MSTLVIRKKNLKLLLLALLGILLIYLGYQNIYISLPTWSKGGDQPVAKIVANPPATPAAPAANPNVSAPAPVSDVPVTAVGVSAKNSGPEFFSEYRLERDRVRSQQMEVLREVVNYPGSTAENRKEAQQKMLNLTSSLQKEMELENLLMAKGFRDGVAMVQPNSVTVIVLAKSLTQDEITRITDVVCRTTNCKADQVVIIPKG